MPQLHNRAPTKLSRYWYSPMALGRETSQRDFEAEAGKFWAKNTNKHWLVWIAAESVQNDRNQQKTVRFQSWKLIGKLKGYLFQKTKLWEELVVLTVKFKKPRSQKKKQEVFKKMVYCVKMSILDSFLYNFILIIILFLLYVSVVWSLNCSVSSSIPNSVFNCVHVFVLSHSCYRR